MQTQSTPHEPTHCERDGGAIQASGLAITEVVCGEAAGVDRMGRDWAERNNIPVQSFPAAWERDRRMAGFERNVRMAEYADALIAVWDGWSTGTAHMIATMAAMGKPTLIYKVELGSIRYSFCNCLRLQTTQTN